MLATSPVDGGSYYAVIYPKAFPVMTESGQRQPITHRWRSCSWDVFPYDLLPNQLRPVDLLLGQVSKGDRVSGGRGTKAGLLHENFRFVQQPLFAVIFRK